MNTKKILRYMLIGGIFMVPFIPLIISTTMFFPFITGKNFAFRILVEILLCGWGILAVLDKAYRPKFTTLFISILAFVGIIALADIFGESPFKSIWSNFERMEGLVSLLHFVGYFVVAGIVLNTEKLWDRFFNTSVFVSILIGLYGLLQIAGKIKINQGGVRLDATFGNASYLAIYMFFHIFITLFLLVRYRGASWVKCLYCSAIILQLVILYFTATRSTLLGLIGGALLTLVLVIIFEKNRPKIRKISIGVLIAIIASIGVFTFTKDMQYIRNSRVLSRLSSITLKEGAPRFKIWHMAYQGFKERPILGWGQENFNFVFNKHYNPALFDQEAWFDRVHNIFFDWLIAGGILGFLAYFSIPILMLYYLWRRLEVNLSVTEKSIVTGLLAGYFFHNMFVFDNIMTYILFFSIASYIYSHSTKTNEKILIHENINNRQNDGMKKVYIPLIIIATIFSLYIFNLKGIIASRALIQAINQQEGGLDVNFTKFEKALSYGNMGKQEIIEQLVFMVINLKNRGVDIETQTKFFELADKNMSALVEERPNDARIRIFYASFLNQFNLNEKAMPHLLKATELSPNKQTIQFELGTSYLNMGEYDKAFEVFEYAYNLDTNFKDAEIIYRVGGIFADKESEVNYIIGPISDIDRMDTRIINAYTKVNRFDEAVKSWKLVVENDPNNAQKHLSLGAAYLQIGQRQLSIDEIQKSIDLNPEFKEQGEFYIQEIRAGRNP